MVSAGTAATALGKQTCRHYYSPMVYSIQIGGALLILAGFVLGQIELIAADGWPYLLLNFLGSALLAASAVMGAQWGFVLLEGCWALASLYGIWRKLQSCPSVQAG